MSTQAELHTRLLSQGHKVDATADSVRGIPAILLRHIEGDRLVVTVGGDKKPKDRVNALVHGLALAATRPDIGILEMRMGASADGHDRGVLSALGSMLASYVGPVDIRITYEAGDAFQPVSPSPPDFAEDSRPAVWAGCLEGWYQARPTGLAKDVIDRFPDQSLRLYPQLSLLDFHDPEWSLRLDGLGVGGLKAASGWLRVGKGETAQVATQAWAQVAEGHSTIPLDAVSGPAVAAEKISQLVSLLGKDHCDVVKHRQPEHALESMVLRGNAVVVVDGEELELPHADSARVQRVAWGSQVPTLWWVGGTARYMDALMRRGSIPYAVELKVRDGGGYGRYLREALTQAVLYRQFIRTAAALHPWTRALGVEPTVCESVVAFPAPQTMAPSLATRLRAFEDLCSEFGVRYWEIQGTGL